MTVSTKRTQISIGCFVSSDNLPSNTRKREQRVTRTVAHQVFNKDNYFLNMMNPATHVFMKRLLVELKNEKKNEQEKKNQEEVTKKRSYWKYTAGRDRQTCNQL